MSEEVLSKIQTSRSTDKRLYNTIADKILGLIESGQFPPGSRLPSERDLADQLGVSRVTVREAQISLQAKGHIDIRTGSGAHVLAAPRSHDALPKVDAFELTQARTVIESEAAALAASQITDEELALLDDILARMAKESLPNAPLEESADKEFHMAIAHAGKNLAIVDAVERLWLQRTENPKVKQVFDSICEVDPDERFKEHSLIVKALKDRDPGAAREAMRHHFSCIMETILKQTEQAAIEAVRKQTSESRKRFLQ